MNTEVWDFESHGLFELWFFFLGCIHVFLVLSVAMILKFKHIASSIQLQYSSFFLVAVSVEL